MADDEIDGKTEVEAKAWLRQLKSENDRLNPALDIAAQSNKALTAALESANAEKARLADELAKAREESARHVKDGEEVRAAATAQAAKDAEKYAGLAAELGAAKDREGKLRQRLSATRAALTTAVKVANDVLGKLADDDV
jgi:predicted  nucleic acid-binding Zn-ribbon protein